MPGVKLSVFVALVCGLAVCGLPAFSGSGKSFKTNAGAGRGGLLSAVVSCMAVQQPFSG